MRREFNTGGTLIMTPVGTANWVRLFGSESYEGGPPKFNIELIFGKGSDLSHLEAAVEAAKYKLKGDDFPKIYRSPFRDGDTDDGFKNRETGETHAHYVGSTVVRFSTLDNTPKYPGPSVVKLAETDNGRATYITNPSEIYSGCLVKVTANCGAYTTGGLGVKFYLENVCKMADGPRIGASENAPDPGDAMDDFGDGSDFGDEQGF